MKFGYNKAEIRSVSVSTTSPSGWYEVLSLTGTDSRIPRYGIASGAGGDNTSEPRIRRRLHDEVADNFSDGEARRKD